MRSKQTTSADFGFRVGVQKADAARLARPIPAARKRCANLFPGLMLIALALFFVAGCDDTISSSQEDLAGSQDPTGVAIAPSDGDPQEGPSETSLSPSPDSGSNSPSQQRSKRLARGEMPEEWIEPQRERVFAIDTNSDKLDLTFDDLKFDIEVGEPFERDLLSEEVIALDGKQITLSGYMRPSFKASGLKGFIFVRDDKECCFGPQAAIYDCVRVKLKRDNRSDYIVRPFKVRGTFFLKEIEGPDGAIWSIFNMKNATIES